MHQSEMQARSPDTDPESWRVQMDLLRQASPARRAQMALTLSAQVIGLARLAIRRSGDASDEESLGLRLVERLYGRELAAEVERHLARNR